MPSPTYVRYRRALLNNFVDNLATTREILIDYFAFGRHSAEDTIEKPDYHTLKESIKSIPRYFRIGGKIGDDDFYIEKSTMRKISKLIIYAEPRAAKQLESLLIAK